MLSLLWHAQPHLGHFQILSSQSKNVSDNISDFVGSVDSCKFNNKMKRYF